MPIGTWKKNKYGEYDFVENATGSFVLARVIPSKATRDVRLVFNREAFGDVAQVYEGYYPNVMAAKEQVSAAVRMAQGNQAGPRRSQCHRASRVTYKQAQAAIMDALRDEGWTVTTRGPSGTLKFPHAVSADKDHKIWFKAQAIYHGSSRGGMNEARSMWLGDIRALSTQDAIAEINRQVVRATY